MEGNNVNAQPQEAVSGGEALARMLSLYDPGPIFGMGGFQLLPFYEALRGLGITHVLVNDERAGAFAADAYARTTGKVGLCDATLGPGATNLVTALVESRNAGIPMLALVGETHRQYSGRNMTQEGDQLDILKPAVKEYIRIEEISRVPELVRRAYLIATSGRPGPVVIGVPEDISHAHFDFAQSDFWSETRHASVPAWRSRPDANSVQEAAQLLSRAERPVILAGGGVHLSGASAELLRCAEIMDAPVAHTLSGKGAIACNDPRSVGLFGRYSRIANELIDSSDALLAVGMKFGEIATRRYSLPANGVPIVHLDSAAEEIGRCTRVSTGLWGDAREGLCDLVTALDEFERPTREQYWSEIATKRKLWLETARPSLESEDSPIHMARLIAELNRQMPGDAILVADGGFASHWSGLFYDTKEAGRRFIADRGFASIGYGLPGAIGAKFGAQGSKVVAITGDGGFNMVAGELETARREGLAFVLVVVNNAASGYVKALQHAVYGAGHYESSDLMELDYSRIAAAYGCHGIRVESPTELEKGLAEALVMEGVPVVVDVVITRDPAAMLPGVDNRTVKFAAGDRPA